MDEMISQEKEIIQKMNEGYALVNLGHGWFLKRGRKIIGIPYYAIDDMEKRNVIEITIPHTAAVAKLK